MQKPSMPLDETLRLVSLHSLRIMDSAPEERFDRVTRMAKRVFGVNICLVSLVDADRQWFKSRQGLDACQTPREVSFCGHAILQESAFVVEDAHRDRRFADNPLVTGNPNVRFYAGYPVHAADGRRIGTLCVIDDKPRAFSDSDAAMLKDFAALIDEELATAAQINVDELTKVANRRGFRQVADHLLPLCKTNKLDVEVLFFDLDGFKILNDKFGHKAGDEALQDFAKLLLKGFRNSDVVARLGGDEFAVMTAGQPSFADRGLANMRKLAANLTSEFSGYLNWSVGRVKFDPKLHSDVDALLRSADEHMYADKFRKRVKTG
ncbi:MAG: sensor domain-containing diguanylate cyclase [Gammaproteobacteria bacterium]|nr:sensor domain-containing diguanylate cyclase [Gammaproteobacteria bacterium]